MSYVYSFQNGQPRLCKNAGWMTISGVTITNKNSSSFAANNTDGELVIPCTVTLSCLRHEHFTHNGVLELQTERY